MNDANKTKGTQTRAFCMPQNALANSAGIC